MNTDKCNSTRTRSLSRAAAVAALLISSQLISSGAPEGTNLLMGSWKFTRLTGTSNACASTTVFKDKVAIITYPATPADPKNPYSTATPARVVNLPVIRYLPSTTQVVTMTGGNGFPFDHTNYNFVDKNHMWTETAYGKCYFERTN